MLVYVDLQSLSHLSQEKPLIIFSVLRAGMGSRGAQMRAAAARGDVGALSSLLLAVGPAGIVGSTAPADPQAHGASNEPKGDGAGKEEA